MKLKIQNTIKLFSHLPHRGAGTKYEKEMAIILKNFYSNLGILEKEVQFSFWQDSLTLYPIIYIFLLLLGAISLFNNLFDIALILTLIALMLLCKYPFEFPMIVAKIIGKKSNAIVSKIPCKHHSENNIIITAHYDSVRQMNYVRHLSQIFGNILIGRYLKTKARAPHMNIPLLQGPFTILNLFAIIQLILVITRTNNIFLILLCSCIYLIGILYAIQGTISDYVQGALDNGISVATSMVLAEYFSKNPHEKYNLYFINNSAEETMTKPLGVIADELKLNKKNSIFINLECISAKHLTICTGEVGENNLLYKYDEDLFQKLKNILDTNDIQSTEIIAPFPTDAHKLVSKGYKVMTTFLGIEDKAILNTYHQKNDTFENIDFEKASQVTSIIKKVIISM